MEWQKKKKKGALMTGKLKRDSEGKQTKNLK